jgi:hypothetical protein
VTVPNLIGPGLVGLVGLVFVLFFFGLMVIFATAGRRKPGRFLREIPAFARLGRAIGLAVEAGQRLHISLGSGQLNGLQGASALVGLSVLERIAHIASISDRPPIASSGDGTLAILSQDTLRSTSQNLDLDSQFEPTSGQLTGITPFSYAVGAAALIYDQQVSASVLAGHFGSEVALITDAGERSGGLSLAGSDSIPGQAVLFATAQEPLIGEELFAAGAYVQAGAMHVASVRAQDFFRWLVIVAILLGAALKLAGVL